MIPRRPSFKLIKGNSAIIHFFRIAEVITGMKFTFDCKHLITVSGDRWAVWSLPGARTASRLVRFQAHPERTVGELNAHWGVVAGFEGQPPLDEAVCAAGPLQIQAGKTSTGAPHNICTLLLQLHLCVAPEPCNYCLHEAALEGTGTDPGAAGGRGLCVASPGQVRTSLAP